MCRQTLYCVRYGVRAIQCVHLIVFPSTVDLPLSNPESAGTSQDTSPCEVLYPLIEHEDVLLKSQGAEGYPT